MRPLFILLLSWAPIFIQAQTIKTFAGNGVPSYSGNGGPATAATVNWAVGVCRDAAGNIYFAEYNNHVIRKVDPAGIITTYAGTGVPGYSGDGGPATAAQLDLPWGLGIDHLGNIFVTEQQTNVIRKIDPSGIITTYAGTGAIGYTGDGGPATAATFFRPSDIAVDPAGNIYFGDGYQVVRKVNTAGIISTFAGIGTAGFSGDGGPATSARLHNPTSVEWGNSGLYIGDNLNNRIRFVNSAGIINTIAGNGTAGYSGDGGPPLAAQISGPLGMAFDVSTGDLYEADYTNNAVRKITATTITTAAGTGVAGFSGDGGPAILARLNKPWGIEAVNGHVWFADLDNNRVRDFGACVVNITGNAPICAGSSITLSSSSAGTWSSNNTPVATVHLNTGIVTGVSTGTAVITLSVSAGCYGTTTVTVLPPPSAISGAISLCAGFTTTLSNAVTGGNWTSGTTTVATVNTIGVVTGVSSGTTVITYTTGSGCSVTSTVTVLPSPGSISGPTAVCVGTTVQLSNTTAGGTWTSSNAAVATIDPVSGMITGLSGGTATISYTLASGCYATLLFTVSPIPPAITGFTSVCAGAITMLSNSVAGGTWSSGSPGVATAGVVSGAVSGLTPGTAVISYAMPGGCFATTSVSVIPAPSAIYGNMSICSGTTTLLSNSVSGGSWSSSAPGVANITGTGLVAAVAAGTTVITYALPTGCFSVATLTVIPMPDTITGGTSLCTGSTISLANSVAGGTWYTAATGIATVSTSGAVTGVSAGIVDLTYSIQGCMVTTALQVKMTPAIAMDNQIELCDSTSRVIGSPQPPGVSYLWSTGSTDSAITITSQGSYTLTVALDGCTDAAVLIVLSMSRPDPLSLGDDTTVCEGTTVVLHSGVNNATWNKATRGESYTVSEGGKYYAYVSNVCGTSSDTVNVFFQNCTIVFPTAFSPNGDGHNDFFRAITNSDAFTSFSMSIFNRWGNRVFFTTRITDGWDGKYKGVQQDPDVFYYMVSYTFYGKEGSLKGDLYLVR